MARYNEILVGRFARAVQKLFGMKGEVPIGSLAGELQVIHSFLSGVENRILEGWQRYAIPISQAAVAAQTNGMQIRNPLGSNVVAVLEKSQFASGVAADTFTENLAPGLNPPDLGATATGLRLDNRSISGSVCLVSNSGASPAQVGTSIALFPLPTASVPLDTILFEDQELLLLPGDALRVTNAQVNATTRWHIIWRERFLEDSERTV